MISVLDLRGDRSDPRDRLPRAAATVGEEVRRRVGDIVASVRDEGDAAVRRWTRQLDGWEAEAFEVDPGETKAAVESLDPELRSALERAADQIRWFHERGRPPDWREVRGGARLGVRHRPLRRVGCYVPGGLAPLLSSALMQVVPAHVAGVDEIMLATPPDADGRVTGGILAAASIAGGVDRVLRIGGAQAVAAMAYGTESVPRCDKVVGPGNAYVAEAKQQVAAAGVCGIDLLAGPTEVAIIADDTADPRLVAADLVAQGEHDTLAGCLLLTPSTTLAAQVQEALEGEVAATRHRDRVRAAIEGQGGIVLVDDLDHAVAVSDAYAPEHLEVHTVDSQGVAEQIRAAGAIFVGAGTPVALGDYCAGPNHTLPTSGTARFAGGLRTDDFLVPINWVEYDRTELSDLAPVVDALGEVEDLPAHAHAVRIRLEDGDGR